MGKNEIKKIWEVPASLAFVQPALTEEMVLDAEQRIGYKLPKEYIELLKIQNGGYIRFNLEGESNYQIYGIGPYFPSILESDYEDLDHIKSKELIRFDGLESWNICLDYRKNTIEPEITILNTEFNTEKNIAKNFKEYLSLLNNDIDIEYKYVIETDKTLKEVIQVILKIKEIEFEEPNVKDYGYTLYRGEYKGSMISVSPNKTPSVYINDEDDDRYKELKSQTMKTALRYPEISENDLLINIYDHDIKEELLEELRKESLTVASLEARISND